VAGEMYLPRAEPFLPQQLARTRKQLADAGLEIACLGSSCRFHNPDEWEAQLREGREYLRLAAALDVPYVRVFGDRIPVPARREETIRRVADGLRQLAEEGQSQGVGVLLEAHGDFSRSPVCQAVVVQADHPNVGILWDIHHPYRFFDETIEASYDCLKGLIRHTHLKDSRRGPDGKPHYCLLGEGDVPVKKAIELLLRDGYTGWLSFEWEKRWHPEIEPPEVALPQFIERVRSYLAEAED
ncbi:MAG TPA: sugar phosphate isomerase/epimerase family protein, partial [Limnochordia bacterium]